MSSISDGLGKDELELPIAMVCIVATTVSLIHFSSSASCTDLDMNRTMHHLMTGVKGINGARATSVLKLTRISTEVMNFSSAHCMIRNRVSITR